MFDEARSRFGKWRQAHRDALDRAEIGRFIDECRQLLTARGESNSVAIAQRAIERYERLPPEARAQFFDVLAEEFDPDPARVLEHAQQYATDRSPQALIALSKAAEPPRQELLRRLNRAPGGAGALVRMRAELLELMRGPSSHLAAVDSDFQHLLGSWFNPGFLQMRRIDWNSPARLLELIIRHEAVHEIDGWDDLRRRLQPDRRCFAFFHPTLPDEPLIFVEVALVPQMPSAIAPLIDKDAQPLTPDRFKVATFYSISNCQPGLRGVNLGNFLIKRVAEELKREFPKLATFCTLSPIPSFAKWLTSTADLRSDRVKPATLREFNEELNRLRARLQADPKELGELAKRGVPMIRERAETAEPSPEVRAQQGQDEQDSTMLTRLCAFHLAHTKSEGGSSDPVARFHLHNGARLERINWAADLSRKGIKQSLGLMVNYLYDLDEIESNHQKFVSGQVNASRAVMALL